MVEWLSSTESSTQISVWRRVYTATSNSKINRNTVNHFAVKLAATAGNQITSTGTIGLSGWLPDHCATTSRRVVLRLGPADPRFGATLYLPATARHPPPSRTTQRPAEL